LEEEDTKHDCPICYDNAEDATVDGEKAEQCFECGQVFCGECKLQLLANFPNCPNCRAPFNVSVGEKVARILQLLERTPGRHTPKLTANAQFELGCWYNSGHNADLAFPVELPRDFVKAAKWYTLAADRGDADAQFKLGVLHANGDGVAQDWTEAARWQKLAAKQGRVEAQFNLALMYDNGNGVKRNFAQAARYYKLAAKQGFAHAQSNLALMYCTGQGVPEDHIEGARWYTLAAAQGYGNAQCNLGVMYECGDGVPQDVTKAAKWYKLAAAQKGRPDAQCNLGMLYAAGKGVPLDLTEAARLLKLAADQGQAGAGDTLSNVIHKGLFPAGTKVLLSGLKTVALNGKRGVTVARSGAAAPALGRIAVELEGGGGFKAIPYEKLRTIW
jgi:TPR repeat protein